MNLRAAVIGQPIRHSRSPSLFKFLASAAGQDLTYTAEEVAPENIGAFLDRLRSETGWVGVNVTLPHKEVLIPLLDSVSPEAKSIGAVNVVRVDAGKLHGINTDVFGIEKTFELMHFNPRGKDAWIYGAGGAARALGFALGKAGAARVYFQNRGAERAQALAADLALLFPETRFVCAPPESESGDGYFSLVANTTSVGMLGKPAAPEFFASMRALRIRAGETLAFDLIYIPEQTPFLDLASNLGMRTVGGLEMLIGQALATWRVWFRADSADESLVRELTGYLRVQIAEESALPRMIFLTGFMGSGKSTVGPHLARRLGFQFLDTDRLVEAASGLKVADIFRERGEPAFRALEKAAVFGAVAQTPVVVALGGGALIDPETQAFVRSHGRVVFLNATAEELFSRLSPAATKRPLLAGLSAEEQREKIRDLLEARLPTYRTAAIEVRIGGKNSEEVAREIHAELGGGGP